MRRLTISLAFGAVLAGGFAAGYFCRVSTNPEMEDYALTNILENVGYVHNLAKGEHEAMRAMLDTSLNEHLTRARLHRTAGKSAEFEAARTRTLNAVAAIWDRYPPFQSAEWSENKSNASWLSEWHKNHQQNLALLQEAKARCAAMPTLNCRAQPPVVRLLSEVK